MGGYQQPSLPYQSHSPTSRHAAASMREPAEKQRERINRYGDARGADGLTVDEIEVDLGIRHCSASARLLELREAGWYAPAGTRKTRSGRPARVYVKLEKPDPAHAFVSPNKHYRAACEEAREALRDGDSDGAEGILDEVLS